jgi:hypothetical protein
LSHIVLALAGVALLGLLFHRLGPTNVLVLFRRLGWGFPAIVVVFGAHEVVRTAALLQCLAGTSRPVFRELLYVRFIGEAVRALTLTGPFLAEPVRGWLMSRRGVHTPYAAAAAIGEYAASSFASSFLTVGAAIYFLHAFEVASPLRVATLALASAAAGCLVLAVAAIRWRIRVIGALVSALARLPGLENRLRPSSDAVRQTDDGILLIFRQRPRTLAGLLSLEFAAHCLLILETYSAVTFMGVDISLVTASVAEILTKLANVAVAGAAEGVYVLLFSTLGLPAAAGFALSLVKRLRSLAVALLGLGSLALLPEG